jgi:hypothetical protein
MCDLSRLWSRYSCGSDLDCGMQMIKLIIKIQQYAQILNRLAERKRNRQLDYFEKEGNDKTKQKKNK